MLPRTPLLIVASLLIACGASAQAPHHGLDPANLDTTCAPCQDFNRYANGGWLARTQLDAQHASYGSVTEPSGRNQGTLRRIVGKLSAAAPPHPPTNDEKNGAFYPSSLGTPTPPTTGAQPPRPRPPRIA